MDPTASRHRRSSRDATRGWIAVRGFLARRSRLGWSALRSRGYVHSDGGGAAPATLVRWLGAGTGAGVVGVVLSPSRRSGSLA